GGPARHHMGVRPAGCRPAGIVARTARASRAALPELGGPAPVLELADAGTARPAHAGRATHPGARPAWSVGAVARSARRRRLLRRLATPRLAPFERSRRARGAGPRRGVRAGHPVGGRGRDRPEGVPSPGLAGDDAELAGLAGRRL